MAVFDGKKVDVVFFDAGSGHRSAARGLERALKAARPGWRVRCVNYPDIVTENRWWSRFVRWGIDEFNWELTRERVFDLPGKVNLGLLFHDLLCAPAIGRLARFWGNDPPDAVVSVMPMYHPSLYRAVRRVNPGALCVTVPVDCEEFKKRYWFEPRVEQHYLLGTERLCQQARRLPIPREFLHPVEGMVVDPELYEPSPPGLARKLNELGLDPALPTGLVHFGGQGSVVIARIARQLALADLRINFLFLCGHNAAVRREVERLVTPYRKAVLGYTTETPVTYQRLADFVIGKPGVMTINEALILGKPLILLKAQGLGPVQVGNEKWAVERGLGVLIESPQEVGATVKRVLASPRYREAAARHYHRGVFTVASRIQTLLSGDRSQESGGRVKNETQLALLTAIP
jgi:processive 1,2-diacylglycerol beta-glucosyltransferase